MTLQAIRYKGGVLSILDQLQLPSRTVYVAIKSAEDGWHAIRTMKVRGAPAIAMVGSLSVVVEIYNKQFSDVNQLIGQIVDNFTYLLTARPTAVNIRKTAEHLIAYIKTASNDIKDQQCLKEKFIAEVERLLEKDLSDNESIGAFGSKHMFDNSSCSKFDKKLSVLTHCNTGSLATTGYGTALGVIRSLHKRGQLDHAYCTETRPYNQGARLTAYELVHDNIQATLIADSMASLLMKDKHISAVVVGADRVARNGDTANKIGTYQLAITAKYHGVPFYVAAPFSSIDRDTPSGDQIEIEHRPPKELTEINGIRIAADGIECWNPAFDITPNNLITGGIVTELGVFSPDNLRKKLEVD